MSRYQKSKTNLDFTEARDSEWQWHQPCSRQTTTPVGGRPHHSVFTGRVPFLPPSQQSESTEGSKENANYRNNIYKPCAGPNHSRRYQFCHTTTPDTAKLSCRCRVRFGGVKLITDNSRLKSDHVQSNRPIHTSTSDTTRLSRLPVDRRRRNVVGLRLAKCKHAVDCCV